jgi:hypothetical protein
VNPQVLLISNSNLFTAISSSYLAPFVHAHVINVRYSNEEMDRQSVFVQQIKEARMQHFYESGLVKSTNDFVFSDRLIYRLERARQELHPDLVIIELRNFKEQEQILLKYAMDCFEVPVVVFTPITKKQEKISSLLHQVGVRDMITNYKKEAFENVIKRNLFS